MTSPPLSPSSCKERGRENRRGEATLIELLPYLLLREWGKGDGITQRNQVEQRTMGELNYPHRSSDWAWEKGLKRKCRHGIEYDPHIGPKCEIYIKEEKERKAKREEKERRLQEAFDNVIWPDNDS